MPSLKRLLQDFLSPNRKKRAFILQLPHAAKLLDVGCGNNSPAYVKALRPDIQYTGLDIADYRQTINSKGLADSYVLTTPERFHIAIEEMGEGRFDAVVSAHNIEHCLHPAQVLSAMCNVLGPSGILFLAFPCEASVHFPSRRGTLNFHDDPTHLAVPVWKDVLGSLKSGGMELIFAAQRYRPLAALTIGLMFEPFVAPLRRQAPRSTTWALYGFESIIWARKNEPAAPLR